MKNLKTDKNNFRCVVIPRICAYSRLVKSILKVMKIRVYYRGDFNPELSSSTPGDLFFLASEAYGKFLNDSLDEPLILRFSRSFSLNPELLAKAGKETLYKNMGSDFLYAFQVTGGGPNKKAQVIYPMSAKNRALFADYLGADKESDLVYMFSSIGYLLEKARLSALLALKAAYVVLRLVYWRLSKPSALARTIRGNFIWVSDGPIEISFDPNTLSLPLYLKQLCAFARFKDKKFAVACPFLSKESYWDNETSFAIPGLRKLTPGLSNHLFLEGIKYSAKEQN